MVLLVYLVVLWLLIQMINHYKIYGIRYKVWHQLTLVIRLL
jgi:hypothetical protein